MPGLDDLKLRRQDLLPSGSLADLQLGPESILPEEERTRQLIAGRALLPQEIPQAPRAGDPRRVESDDPDVGDVLRAQGKLTFEQVKELMVALPTFPAGVLVAMANTPMKGYLALDDKTSVFLTEEGRERVRRGLSITEPAKDKLFSIARAAWDDSIEAHAEFTNTTADVWEARLGEILGPEQARAIGEAAGATQGTAQFGLVNSISPTKYFRTAAAIFGMLPKAAVLAYGGTRLAKRGIYALREMVETAGRLGHLQDTSQDLGRALDVVVDTSKTVEKLPPDRIASEAFRLHSRVEGFEQELAKKGAVGRFLSTARGTTRGAKALKSKVEEIQIAAADIAESRIAERSQRIAQERVNFPFAPTAMQAPVAPGQEQALEVATALERSRRRFAPRLQTGSRASARQPFEAGPKKEFTPPIGSRVNVAGIREEFGKGGRKFLPKEGDIQSQLSRAPLERASVGGGLPASFGEGKIRAAVKPVPRVRVSETPGTLPSERVGQAQKELQARARDAKRRGADQPHTPAPDEAPSHIIGDPATWGRRKAHQYIYNRDGGVIEARKRADRVRELFPDKKVREDLTGIYQRTGNALVSHGDTLEQAERRVGQSTLARNVPDFMRDMRQRSDHIFDEMNELDARIGDQRLNYVDNWLHQTWADYGSKAKQINAARAARRGSFERHRLFSSYFHGMTSPAKLTPRSLDIADVVEMQETAYARVRAMKLLLDDLAHAGLTDAGEKVFKRGGVDLVGPRGYTRFDMPYMDKVAPGAGELFIHNEVLRPLKVILTGRTANGKIEQAIDTLASITKRANFSFSMFHAGTLTESAINAGGPIRGPLVAAQVLLKGRSVPFGARLNDTVDATSIVKRMGGWPAVEEALKTHSMKTLDDLARFHGVTAHAPHTDLMLGGWERALEKAIKVPVAGPVFKGYRFAQRHFDAALWNRVHAPYKNAFHGILYDNMIRTKRGDYAFAGLRPIKGLQQRMLKNLSDDEIGFRVGAFINDEFGSQNWELHYSRAMQFLAHPDRIKWLRRFAISPDWVTSSLRAGFAITQLIPGTQAYDPVRGILGAKHWLNAFLGTYTYANIMNHVLTGRFIWQNEPGRNRTHIDLGIKDESGKKLFINIGKQYKESFGALTDPQGYILSKMMPHYNTAISPYNDMATGYRTHLGTARERAFREAREMYGRERAVAMLKDIGEAYTPFMAKNIRDTSRPWLALSPFPVAGGMTLSQGRIRMAEALRDEDDILVDRVYLAMLDNGHDPKKVRQAYDAASRAANRSLLGDDEDDF